MALTLTKIPYLTRVFGAARGCSMGCAYCSTARWSHRLACPKCRAREVHFHEERLGDPVAAKKPQVIGVSFYDELWDPLRSDLDVAWVLAACDSAPQHQYVFLTKRPERVDAETVRIFADHPNWWLGVTVEGRVPHAYRRLTCSMNWAAAGVQTWLSLEPWLGGNGPPNLFRAINESSFVAIGCESGREAEEAYDEPWQEDVQEIVEHCRAKSDIDREAVPVFVKQVWVNGRCSRDPAEWPETLRVQELPEAWKKIIQSEECRMQNGTTKRT